MQSSELSVSWVTDSVNDNIQPAVNHDLIELELFWELCLATAFDWLRRCVYVCVCVREELIVPGHWAVD